MSRIVPCGRAWCLSQSLHLEVILHKNLHMHVCDWLTASPEISNWKASIRICISIYTECKFDKGKHLRNAIVDWTL